MNSRWLIMNILPNQWSQNQVPIKMKLLVENESSYSSLTLILLTWRIWWAPNNASKWQMGFNLAFKGLIPSKNVLPLYFRATYVTIKNIKYKGPHVKCLIFLSHFKHTWTSLTYLNESPQHEISQKSVQWKPSCSIRTGHTAIRINMTKLIVGFWNFANMPKSQY